MARVTVVGGGVVGLTSALRLAESGHRVRCVRDIPAPATVSAVAGGLWFPYHVQPRDRVVGWGLTSLHRFQALADDPATGVAVREGLLVERAGPDRWWVEGVEGWREATADELPPGATSGVVAGLPLVAMPTYLPWLEQQCLAAGVELATGRVGDLDELEDDLVVLATGLRTPELLPDVLVTPSRGQVALLANPGIERWFVDGDAPDGVTYVLPHAHRVVCGGTDVPGSDLEPDAAVHAAIVARCRAAVPALRDAEVLGSRVGLRPVAPAVDLRVHTVHGRPVVTNVGHGGAGVTLSWGCADEVVGLVADLA
ncbi:NAD(P)/FAD-dependent oxidoreductase [Phycicoccus duodecadis]|uniref:D-amino-acid oxidase n=1 Tax=Phycicoccus duodecadis TaxID=173053 RepID=A0A2N3YKI3_9MICO|nr:FAD-dependent oxidoreductase [Phycicoccus duodecadis]PKW27364.1 D-amino-acid:oxygen oxidoreductase (deaminating) [Phycicoccus duodecadis]